jgi:hypothetical protein
LAASPEDTPQKYGATVFTGAGPPPPAAATDAVAAELADDEPPAFVAVTTERIVLPTSLPASVYELPVAPEIPTQPAPELLQSSHWYPKPDGLPDQPPLLVDSVWPCTACPVTTGTDVLDGADTPTTEVAAEDDADEPPSFVAVTTERIVLPTSLPVSVYELPEAPEIPTQPPPELPQSSHPYAKPDGLPDHPPLLVESVRPSCAVPLIAGAVVFDGPDILTGEVAAELADDEPPAFVAVTAERIVLPTSLLVSVYELPVAPEIPTQLPPDELQSCHWYP